MSLFNQLDLAGNDWIWMCYKSRELHIFRMFKISGSRLLKQQLKQNP